MPRDQTVDLSTVIAEIKETHRVEQILHRAEKSLTLQIKAIERRLRKRYQTSHVTHLSFETIAQAAALPLMQVRLMVKEARKPKVKRLRELARALPVHHLIKGTPGFAEQALAQIVGEAGDLSRYPNPAKLWTRMGVGIIDGKSQRRIAGDKEAAKRQKFNPHRRAVLYAIGVSIHMKQVKAFKDEEGNKVDESVAIGGYGAILLDRYAATAERGWSSEHRYRDAKRVMEKRLLVDLWEAWRAASRCM